MFTVIRAITEKPFELKTTPVTAHNWWLIQEGDAERSDEPRCWYSRLAVCIFYSCMSWKSARLRCPSFEGLAEPSGFCDGQICSHSGEIEDRERSSSKYGSDFITACLPHTHAHAPLLPVWILTRTTTGVYTSLSAHTGLIVIYRG